MNRHAAGLFAGSAVAVLGYVAVSAHIRDRKTRRKDAKARRKALRTATPRAKKLAETTGHIGKWYTHVPLALVGARLLAKRDRIPASATIAGASLAAAVLSRVLDRVHGHRTPPPGKGDPSAQSYPSGHALETTAVAFAAGWVLAREHLAPVAAIAPAAAIASLVSGAGRLVLDRHWASDSIAGYLAGIALGSTAAGAYELAADR